MRRATISSCLVITGFPLFCIFDNIPYLSVVSQPQNCSRRLSASSLSRLACSQRAASLRLGLVSASFGRSPRPRSSPSALLATAQTLKQKSLCLPDERQRHITSAVPLSLPAKPATRAFCNGNSRRILLTLRRSLRGSQVIFAGFTLPLSHHTSDSLKG